MRDLKYHERKLLKKVDFVQWKSDPTLRENGILQRYHIQDRDDYVKYNKICGQITKLVKQLQKLDANDPFRIKTTEHLLQKLYNLGVLLTPSKGLGQISKITASSFCRRRLPVIMVKLKMSENLREAITFIEQGHIRVGPEVVSDPAFLVTRSLEDFVTWVDTSKIKRHIQTYNERLDDYEMMAL